ncbi:MAG TPA: hypothetical protein VE959_05900 [Bryobacteraceae bacterium]|nr:hypothetical protein [Bryobacteraceae bacterium]
MMRATHILFAAAASLIVLENTLPAQQTTLSYYFAHIAAADVWRTTFTYVNASTQTVTCNTSFFSDSGAPLTLSFNGSSVSSTSDTIPAGGTARRQTDAQPNLPGVTGWAAANCTGPVKASSLFRRYNGTVPQAEASVIAMTYPASQFVTYADQLTGVAYANPGQTAATVTFTARDQTGTMIASKSIALAGGSHGAQNLGPLFGVASFQGSVTITATSPIVSLSLNAEASPIISSLPPGQPDNSSPVSPATYYFAHIAAADVWRTTFTYVNAGSQPVTCNTSFFSDTGTALPLSFGGVAVTSTSDAIAAGGTARRQTDAQPNLPVVTGWAVSNCSGPVKASSLFRRYNGSVPVAEASVIAMNATASRFITYADQTTGVAYANPSANPAKITFSAQDTGGAAVATASLTLAAGAHGAQNMGPLLGVSSFQGSITITSLQPIVSLSLNAEASPSFSSLPAGEGAAFEIYGAWHCSSDSCTWRTVRDMTDFDKKNHWMIDRGDGSGLPSVNLVVLSFVQPVKLLNLTSDSETVNGIPIGMNSAILNYFTSHNVRVMLSVGGATYTTFWDQALTTNATQLGVNAANAAKALGVGIEIDYENDTSPNLAGLQDFITAYRSVLPYDATGANPAARLTIDLAAGDRSLVAICRKATSDWLTGSNPVLDYANATVPNGQPAASDAESNWQEHVSGRTNVTPPIVPLAPARVTVAVRVVIGSTAQPECNNFNTSLQSTTGIFLQTIVPDSNPAGVSPGMLGYMFWGVEAQDPATCEGGAGVGARNYNIRVPMPPLRQQ